METAPYVDLVREKNGIRGDFHIGLISGLLRGVVEGGSQPVPLWDMDEMEPVDGAGSVTGEGERVTFVLEVHDGDSFAFGRARQHEQGVDRWLPTTAGMSSTGTTATANSDRLAHAHRSR